MAVWRLNDGLLVSGLSESVNDRTVQRDIGDAGIENNLRTRIMYSRILI